MHWILLLALLLTLSLLLLFFLGCILQPQLRCEAKEGTVIPVDSLSVGNLLTMYVSTHGQSLAVNTCTQLVLSNGNQVSGSAEYHGLSRLVIALKGLLNEVVLKMIRLSCSYLHVSGRGPGCSALAHLGFCLLIRCPPSCNTLQISFAH